MMSRIEKNAAFVPSRYGLNLHYEHHVYLCSRTNQGKFSPYTKESSLACMLLDEV